MQLPGFGGVGLNRSTARLLVLAAFYILFLVLGAAIFSAIEGPEEAQRVRQLRQLRKNFLLEHKCVNGEYCHLFFSATHEIPMLMESESSFYYVHKNPTPGPILKKFNLGHSLFSGVYSNIFQPL
jgi:hypothetical protein